MCKSEIFAETLNLVSQETEIPVNRILSSDKDTETVTVPYSPIAAVPNCVAYQYGLYGGFNPYAAGNGFWG